MPLFFILLLLLCAPATLLAQSHTLFPPDFTPSPCAPQNNCTTFKDTELESAASKFYGLPLNMKWVLAHRQAILQAHETACRRHATCLATPGNPFWFCDDILAAEVRGVCDRIFPNEEQCNNYREVWLLGIDIRAKPVWAKAQECAAKLPPVAHTKPLEVWVKPEVVPPAYKGKLTFFALDPETKVPIYAVFSIENQIWYASASPAGLPATNYPFDFQVKLKRVPNGEGHRDVVPPIVTVKAEGYPTITFPLNTVIPKMIVEMKPAASELHRGRNTIVVSARDSLTGKPVEGRVMFDGDVAGETDKPLTLEVDGKGHYPEIWVTNLFNRYSDVVVAKGLR